MTFEAVLRPQHASLRRRGLGLAGAIALHAGLVAIALVQAIWHVDELSPPTVVIDLVASTRPPPPPKFPAVPPVQQESRGPRGANDRTPNLVVAPAATEAPVPEAIEDDDAADPTESVIPGAGGGGGEACVGPDCPRGKAIANGSGGDCSGPHCGGAPMLGPQIGERQCISCPQPHVPPHILAVNNRVTFMARICVGVTGNVERVSILKGISAPVDSDIVGNVRRWRFAPHTVNGNAVPFCYAARFVFVAGH